MGTRAHHEANLGHVISRARELRRAMTPAEAKLWSRLRGGRMARLRFRRQHPVGPYVTDFCCEQFRTVIEVDGHLHGGTAEQDEHRTTYLEANGYRVIRFGNLDVANNLESVLEAIKATCNAAWPSPVSSLESGTKPPLPKGED
jgi:very-short-patch-repair endonuclease